ncbi:MAG: hypothetical protein ACREKE_01230, partial [bacterium]
MIQEHEALLFLDLDKQGPPTGATDARRLGTRLRSGWLQFHALRALALEAAPEPGEKLLREALARCRRTPPDTDSRPLRAAPSSPASAGAQDQQFPRGLTVALATGVVAVVWLAFHLGSTGWGGTHPDLARVLAVPSLPAAPP